MLLDNTYGRPDLKEHFVASRKTNANGGWDNKSPAIAKARQQYEAGTHTMITRKWEKLFLLYSIPQEVVTPRPGFFVLRHEDGRLSPTK